MQAIFAVGRFNDEAKYLFDPSSYYDEHEEYMVYGFCYDDITPEVVISRIDEILAADTRKPYIKDKNMKLSREQYKLISKMFVQVQDLNGNEVRTVESLEQAGLVHKGPQGTVSLTPEAFNVLSRGKRIYQ